MRTVLIKSPRGTTVWLAVVKDDGTTAIPEVIRDDYTVIPDGLNNPEFKKSYHKFFHETFEGLIDLAYDASKSGYCNSGYYTKTEFTEIASISLKSWANAAINTKQDTVQYGATCVKCRSHNEYAIKKDNFICGSCKSYKEM